MGLRSQPFTTISITVVLMLAYSWIAATFWLPFGMFSFWLFAPTTWWGIIRLGLLYLCIFALLPLVSRDRKRRQPKNPMQTRTLWFVVRLYFVVLIYLQVTLLLATNGIATFPWGVLTLGPHEFVNQGIVFAL